MSHVWNLYAHDHSDESEEPLKVDRAVLTRRSALADALHSVYAVKKRQIELVQSSTGKWGAYVDGEILRTPKHRSARWFPTAAAAAKAAEKYQPSEKELADRKARALAKTKIVEDIEPDALAKAAGVTPRTARKWIDIGGAPRHAQDVAVALAMGDEPYQEPRAGQGKAIKEERLEALAVAMREFVEAVREQVKHKVIAKKYKAWREQKDAVRGRVSRKAWAAFIEEMGEELDLPDIGIFSKEHFRKS